MRILTRYLLREVGLVLAFTLFALTMLLVGLGVAKEAIDQGLGVVHVLKLVPYVLPSALLFAIPGTMLFAVSTVYGRMSGDGEFIALKSLGIHPLKMLAPTFAVATGFSLVTVWLNDVETSWGYAGVQQVVLEGVEEIAYGLLRSQQSFSNRHFAVSVKEVDGKRLVLPTITLYASGAVPQVTITADEAEISSQPGAGSLTLRCTNGRVEAGSEVFEFPDTIEREIPLLDPSEQGPNSISPSHLALHSVPGRLAEARHDLELAQQRAAAQAGYWMLTGELRELSSGRWSAFTGRLDGMRGEIARLNTETPRRWASGFSCLAFALVGAPVAIRLRNSDYFMSFFACFLPILLAYYPLLVWGISRAKAGAVPPHTVWLGNVVLAVWGGWVLRRVIRY